MAGNVESISRKTGATGRRRPPQAGKIGITIQEGELPENVDALASAIAQAPDIFTYGEKGEMLVHLHPHQDHATLIPIEPAHLAEVAGQYAAFEKFDARSQQLRPTDCPRRLAESYIARRHWPEQKPLAGVIAAPTVTTEGRLIDRPGYDRQSRLYLASDPATLPGYSAISPTPTKADAVAALDVLKDAFGTWPFVEKSDQAAAIAALLSTLMRRSFTAAPMVAISAAAAGSGKSLLADFIGVIATAAPLPVTALNGNDDEAEKRIHSTLLAGDPAIMLDNISKPLGLDVLCTAITQASSRIRPLGGSSLVTISNCTQIFATGNSLVILGDLKRRTLLIRLDAGMENPELRHFDRNALQFARANRGRLIAAALTIPLAYIAAGRPAVELLPFGSFDDWDACIRRPLSWLGMSDPLAPAAGLRALDPEVETTRLLLTSWQAVFQSRAVTAAEVVTKYSEPGPASGDYLHPDLRDALQAVCFEKITSRRLAGWLRANRGKIAEGLKIEQAGTDAHTKSSLWKVEVCG